MHDVVGTAAKASKIRVTIGTLMVDLIPLSGLYLIAFSVPEIHGRKIANLTCQFWTRAMMRAHLGQGDAAAAIMSAIEQCLKDGPRTPDIGGRSNPEDVGRAIAGAIGTCVAGGVATNRQPLVTSPLA